MSSARPRLEALEAGDLDPLSPELLVSLAWLALDAVPVGEAELKGARRRAMLVLAAGGDPHRDLDLDSVAVERLSDELDSPERRDALAAGLDALDAEGLPRVSDALATLRGEPGLAWRMWAFAVVADALADE